MGWTVFVRRGGENEGLHWTLYPQVTKGHITHGAHEPTVRIEDRSVPFAPFRGDQIIVFGRLEDGGRLRVRAARRGDAWDGFLCRIVNDILRVRLSCQKCQNDGNLHL